MPAPAPEKKGASLPTPAMLYVSLPADAKLLIDNAATTSTSANRVLVSPALNPGQEYQYTLKAEMVRDGKTVAETRRITVKAGQETHVDFNLADVAFAQK